MSWIPPNLADLCPPQSQVSTCAPTTIMFLAFLTKLFGTSKDKPTHVINDCEYSPNEVGKSLSSTVFEALHGVHREEMSPKFGMLHSKSDKNEDYEKDDEIRMSATNNSREEKYDFIVVGAGSAGCVIANRLSEIKEWKILLLEAGIEQPLVSEVPALAPALRGSNIDWHYRTVPMKKACRSKKHGTCLVSRGKVMGGSSVLNYMMYIRGNSDDYNTWQQLGNDGWSYEEVLPYFKKSEDNNDEQVITENPDHHGTGGYQTVERFKYADQNVKILLAAFGELGYNQTDANAQQQLGSVHIQSTAVNGAKQSTNTAFIRPIRYKRPNLTIKTESHASRIIIDPNTKTAKGVEYYSKGCKNPKVALASKEVIVSAGAINSPKLLLLSGIGPANELRQNNIEIVHNLPVGRNLQDHVTTDGLIIVLSNETATSQSMKRIEEDALQWLHNKTGPLASLGSLEAGAFVKTPFETKNGVPDIQFAFDGRNAQAFAKDPAGSAESPVIPWSYYNSINIRPILLAPRTSGTVRLNQSDPMWGSPLIDPNFFGNPADLEAMLSGIRIAQNLFRTKAFRDNGLALLCTPLPACKSYKFDSDDYWRCILMEYTTSLMHGVGTCKMGPKNDTEAVVDSKLRVYGIQRLRVADASIMPIIVRGNTNAPTIMIGEKASDMIKDDWQREEYS